MTRALRLRHRRVFAVLGVILPVALVIGITSRKPVPTAASLPRELAGESPRFAVTQWSRGDLFAKTRLRVALVRERAGAGRFAIELSAAKDFAKPDLLIYWIAVNGNVGDVIPDNAVLLGSFNGSAPLLIPSAAQQASGVLILYSLADHEIVDVSRPITL